MLQLAVVALAAKEPSATPTSLTMRAATGSAGEKVLSFTVFSTEPMDDLAYVQTEGEPAVSVILYPTARSLRHKVGAKNLVRFVHAANGARFIECEIEPGISEGLFILSFERSGSSARRPVIRLIDDGFAQHPSGTLRLINFSGLKLEGSINRYQMSLPSGGTTILRVESFAEINLRTTFEGRSYRVFAETIRPPSEGRALLLLLPPYHRGSLEVQSRVLLDEKPGKALGRIH